MTDKKLKVYYGVLPLKKNQRYGSMKEAVDANQVRYFGLKKIDPLIVNNSKKNKKAVAERKESKLLLGEKIVQITGKLNKLAKSIPTLKTKLDVIHTKAEIDKLDKEKKELMKQYKNFD
jgi:IMP dehydrogenase/GMP reductase